MKLQQQFFFFFFDIKGQVSARHERVCTNPSVQWVRYCVLSLPDTNVCAQIHQSNGPDIVFLNRTRPNSGIRSCTMCHPAAARFRPAALRLLYQWRENAPAVHAPPSSNDGLFLDLDKRALAPAAATRIAKRLDRFSRPSTPVATRQAANRNRLARVVAKQKQTGIMSCLLMAPETVTSLTKRKRAKPSLVSGMR